MSELKDKFDCGAMVDKIVQGQRFAFVRYSDGDWNGMLGRDGGIPGEHKYGERLGQALRESLVPEPEQGYHIGIMPSLLTPGKWWASDKVIEHVNNHPKQAFCSSMILHNAGMRGELDKLFIALAGLRLCVVGNADMVKMKPWLGDFTHVVIPPSDCWEHRAEIEPRIMGACQSCDVALFACSMPAKVWIRKAWCTQPASLIDIGSVFDPYIGRLSRSYMKQGMHKLSAPLYQ